MNPIELINHLVKQIGLIAITTVKSLKTHVFTVNVRNFSKVQEIEGKVTVDNQKILEQKISGLENKLDEVKNAIVSQVYPSEVRVKNIMETPLPREIKIPEFPREIDVKVTNPQKEIKVSNLIDTNPTLKKLLEVIQKLKLDPKIEVKAPQVNVKTEPPIVNIPKSEKLISDDPEKYVPVRLSDGEKFYKALEEVITASGRLNFSDSSGKKNQALINEERHVQVDIHDMPSVGDIKNNTANIPADPAREDGNLNDLLLLFKQFLQSPIVKNSSIDTSYQLRVSDGVVGGISRPTLNQSNAGNPLTASSTPVALTVYTGPVDQRWEMMQRGNIEYNEMQRSKFTFA